MTYDEFARIALSLPDVHEKVGKTECDLFRSGRHMARVREKGTAIAIRLPWEWCDELLATGRDLFFVTPHYDGYPYVLAWLEKLDAENAECLIKASWAAAPEALPARIRPRV